MPQSNSSASPTSTVSSPTTPTKRQAGFINKKNNLVNNFPIEQRAIGGPCRRRYWFALSDDSPYFYWYKNKGDITCLGRISLSGAAFTFDPRQTGTFEIHVNDQVHVLETADNKSRLQWLRKLQSNRRRHYERENVDDILKVEIVSLSSHSGENNEQEQQRCGDDQKAENDNTTGVDNEGRVAGDDPSGLTGAEQAQEVVVPGPSDEKSLEEELFEATQSTFYLNSNGELNAKSLEMPSPMPPSTEILKNAEEVLVKIADETKALEVPAKRVISKARSSFRLPSFSSHASGPCEHCKTLVGIVNELKDRCYELTDEVGANQDMVTVLRQTLIKANHQIEILKTMAELKSARDRVNFILERESEVIALQLNAAEHNREVRNLKQHIKELEERNNELNMAVEAFRDSVRTKEELIMKLCREQDLDASIINDVDVPEGILVDIGNPNGLDDGAQRVFDETAVNDVNEMRDLVEGYKNQNMFLNQEVLELQRIVQSLEERERRIIRQNFDIEACYYQLKSRYIMVLNHFKEDAPSTSARVLEPGVIEELIDETNWTAEKRTLANAKTELRVTDSLGFYLDNDANTRRRRQTSSDLLDVAVKLQEKTNKIIGQQRLEQSPQFMNWLQKWDGFLVNCVGRPLKMCDELKALIRTGVPKTYRERVWKSLVAHWVDDQRADLGNGYYQTLLRKVRAVTDDSDTAIKQIDLDLARTLPTNKFFDEPNSSKISALRRVLCAYRFHNKQIGYCQGLNRLAAIGLLFLDEADAFWFLVTCVEHLQPIDYYTQSLRGAIADQKVLRDLVGEKLPRFSTQLKKFDVDLSAFTLSWFLTCFVDIFPHAIYMQIFDVFLYEGNKVLFRFALAALKLAEPSILECKSVGGMHAALSDLAKYVNDYKSLAQIAFNELNPFPHKAIESKRSFYVSQMVASASPSTRH